MIIISITMIVIMAGTLQINDTLKDRVDDSERGKLDAQHLVDLLKREKQDLIAQKTELFNVSI